MIEYLIAHIGHTTKSCEHVYWWNPDGKGYTICVDKAGRYSGEQAAKICRTGECIAVAVDSVEPLARSTPYYRLTNGTLAKLYDGGPHRPVQNSRGVWHALMLSRTYPQAVKPSKPTPIAVSKARAIYLDGVAP